MCSYCLEEAVQDGFIIHAGGRKRNSKFRQFLTASRTDQLPFEGRSISFPAENAAGGVLPQNDLVILCEDFKAISFRNVQCPPQFDGENYPAKLVNLTNNTSGFHFKHLSLQ